MELILLFISLNFIIFLNLSRISKLVNIYDKPDNERKFHRKTASVIGGTIFYVNYITYIIYITFIDHQTSIIKIRTILDFITWIVFPSLVFIMGLYDDKKNLKGLTKFILISLMSLIFILIDQSLLLKTLKFNFLYNQFSLNIYSIPFTVFCIICFLNAFNMFDGVDLQVAAYIIFIIIFLFFKTGIFYELIPLFFGSILFFYCNAKKNIFLGDSGTYFVGLIISLYFIKSYNLNLNILCDEILVIMLLPGLEMARLFIERILNKKNPLLADRNHFHHLLLRYFENKNKDFVILTSSIVYYLLVMIYLIFQSYEIIFFYILTYFIFINYLKRKID